MTDQLDIDGNIVPLTWDGEPVYSPETVREGLFDREAFIQLRGQTAFETDTEYVYALIGLSGKCVAWSFHELEANRLNRDYFSGECVLVVDEIPYGMTDVEINRRHGLR